VTFKTFVSTLLISSFVVAKICGNRYAKIITKSVYINPETKKVLKGSSVMIMLLAIKAKREKNRRE
jgi:hypothetical protein